MTADKARQNVEDFKNSFETLLKEAFSSIEEASKRGKTSISIERYDFTIASELESLGFKVSGRQQRNGDYYYFVSW